MNNIKPTPIPVPPKELTKADEMREEMNKYYESLFDENVYNMILDLIKIKASQGASKIFIDTVSDNSKCYKYFLERLQKDGFNAGYYNSFYFCPDGIPYIKISWEK